jgi:hypothetical protein
MYVAKLAFTLPYFLQGNLDPIDGYVVYSLVQKSLESNAGEIPSLHREINDYEKILRSKYPNYNSRDTLDLGMTLWTTHWFADEAEWAKVLTAKAVSCLGTN